MAAVVGSDKQKNRTRENRSNSGVKYNKEPIAETHVKTNGVKISFAPTQKDIITDLSFEQLGTGRQMELIS